MTDDFSPQSRAARIHPLDLPSLAIWDKPLLPAIPAIYFVLRGSKVIYINKTKNLKRHWGAHFLTGKLATILDQISIAWYECDPDFLTILKAAFIEQHQPGLNARYQYTQEDDDLPD